MLAQNNKLRKKEILTHVKTAFYICREQKRNRSAHHRYSCKQGINILGSVINDGTEYGVIRMVVSDPEKALASLKEADYLCKLIDVLGVEVADEVGNLNELLKALSDSNVSAEYIYLSFNRDSGKPIMVLYTDDIYEVECCLKSKGFVML